MIELLEEYSLALLGKIPITELEKEVKKLEWDKESAIKLVYESKVKN